MKNLFSTLILLLISNLFFGQTKFEQGYIITKSGERQEVLIENPDWLNNPASIRIKNSDSALPKTLNASEIREFSVGGSTFISENVSFDRTVENLSDLTTDYAPENVAEHFTIRKLVGGDLELFKYQDKKLVRYFYRKDGGEIQQLIYKPYYSAPKVLSFNETYKNQLSTILTCGADEKKIRSSRYSQKDLMDLFTAQNRCANPDETMDVTANQKGNFNISLRPRLIFSNIKANQPLLTLEHNQIGASALGFGFGVELEYLLPFNQNRFGLVVEPTYRTASAEKSFSSSYIVGDQLIMDYKSSAIEIPVSVRYYMPVNSSLKFFMNGGVGIDLDMDQHLIFTRNDGSLFSEKRDLKTSIGVVLGAGMNLSERFSGEFRYRKYTIHDVKNNTFSFILGYRIF